MELGTVNHKTLYKSEAFPRPPISSPLFRGLSKPSICQNVEHQDYAIVTDSESDGFPCLHAITSAVNLDTPWTSRVDSLFSSTITSPVHPRI